MTNPQIIRQPFTLHVFILNFERRLVKEYTEDLPDEFYNWVSNPVEI
jgi:hypothetical protein